MVQGTVTLTDARRCRNRAVDEIQCVRNGALDANTESLAEVIDAQLGVALEIGFDELKRNGHASLPLSYGKYKAIGGFLTPTRKIELYSTRLEQLGYDPLPHYREPPESPLSTPELAREYPLRYGLASKRGGAPSRRVRPAGRRLRWDRAPLGPYRITPLAFAVGTCRDSLP